MLFITGGDCYNVTFAFVKGGVVLFGTVDKFANQARINYTMPISQVSLQHIINNYSEELCHEDGTGCHKYILDAINHGKVGLNTTSQWVKI